MKPRFLLLLLFTIAFLQFADAAFEIEHLGTRAVGIGGIRAIADEHSRGLISNPIGALTVNKFTAGVTHQNLFSSWASLNGFNASFHNKMGAFSCGYLELSQEELSYREKLININYATKVRRLSLGLGLQVTKMIHRYGGGDGKSLNVAMQFDVNPRYKLGILATSAISKNNYETGNTDKKPTVISLGNSVDITEDTNFKLEIVNKTGLRLGVEKLLGKNFIIRGGVNEHSTPTFGFTLQKDKLCFEYSLLMNEGGYSSLLSIMTNL